MSLSNILAITFSTANFLDMLAILVMGLVGIFLVTGLIILCIYLLNKVTRPRRKKENNPNNEQQQ